METQQEQYEGPDRRQTFQLSAAERTAIAEEAARLLWQDVYEDTGKTAFRVLKLLVWAAGISLLAWLGVHAKVPPLD